MKSPNAKNQASRKLLLERHSSVLKVHTSNRTLEFYYHESDECLFLVRFHCVFIVITFDLLFASF